jgi:hypothetical protein
MRPRGDAGGLLFGVAGLLGLVLLAAGLFDTVNLAVDDVFISFRYAENLVRGQGLVFNPGEWVEGYSNLLWTLLLAAFAAMGHRQSAGDFALLVPAKLAGAAFTIATVLVLAAYLWRLRRREEWGPYGALLGLPLAILGGNYSFGLWGVSGMETPMAAFFVTSALVLQLEALRRYDDTSVPSHGLLAGAALLFGLATAVRPEPVFVWGLATAAFLPLAPRPLRGAVLRAALLTLAVYAVHEAWRWRTYHALIPNSVVAKTGGGVESAVLGVKYAFAAWFAAGGHLAIGLLGLPALARSRGEWTWLALFVGSYSLFAVGSGGDWMPGYRLLVPALPAMAVLLTASLLVFARRLAPVPPAAGVALVVAALTVLAFASERNLVRSQRAFPSGLRTVTWQSSPLRMEVARALGRVAAPGSIVALAECGYIPYFNPDLRFLDVLGLMDRDFARMKGMDPDYFLSRAPDYYLVMVRWGRPSRESVPLLASTAFRARYERIAYFDGLARRLEAMEEGREPPLEEDHSFLLFRRRQEP